MRNVTVFTFEVEVENDGDCPVSIAGGIENWIDDCEGVIDSRLVGISNESRDED